MLYLSSACSQSPRLLAGFVAILGWPYSSASLLDMRSDCIPFLIEVDPVFVTYFGQWNVIICEELDF